MDGRAIRPRASVPPPSRVSRMIGWAELGYAYLGIIFYDQAIIAAFRSARGDGARRPGETEVLSTITQLFLLVTLVCILAARWRKMLALAKHLAPMFAVTAITVLSVAWSHAPLVSLRRGTSYMTCVMFGMYLCSTFGLERTIGLIRRSAVVLGILSILVYLALPSIGRETALGYENAMRGVFSQKNPMTECMLLGLTCVAYGVVTTRRLTWGAAGSLALMLLCILLGRSASSLGVAVLMLFAAGLMFLRPYPVLRGGLLLFAGWIVLAIVSVLVIAPEALLGAMGRDATLTGRIPLWGMVITEIAHQPLLGHGYAGFWIEDSRDVQYIWKSIGWAAPDAHSGYLDVALQLGLLGVCAYVWLWSCLLRRTRAALRLGVPAARWVVLFALTVLLIDLDEGPLPLPDEFTMMMPIALAAMSVAVRRRAAPPRAARRVSFVGRRAPPAGLQGRPI